MESKKPKRKRRTKAEMEADRKSKGLGDAVEAVTKATGIKAFVEFMNGGEPCSGCEKRKKWLNKISRRRPEALTLEEFKFIESIKDKKNLKASENINLAKTHARVYRTTYDPPGNCSSCAIQKHKDLVGLYNSYLEDI